MLHGIHPLLTADLLAALDRLGHGDELVVADANFPSYRMGAPVVELPGASSPAVVAAVRTVVPLDRHEGPAVLLMTSDEAVRPVVQQELVAAATVVDDRVESIERFAFYDRAARARLVIRSGEARAYGNLIMRKGVVQFGEAGRPAP